MLSLSVALPLLLCVTLLATCVKRIWFHPLSKHPGPRLWAASRIPYVVSLLRGTLNEDMLGFHLKYGDIVRLAPNELSFAVEEGWRDIYMHRPGHKETQKDKVWYIAPNDMPQNIVTTMDIISDLALGESFHCLDGSTYHPWVRTLFYFFKGMIIVAAARFFPATEFLLQRLIPVHILERQRQHTEFTNEKIAQRLEFGTSRPDLITPFLKAMEKDKTGDKMSLGEIQSTFAIILVAGSETTATTLLGVFYKLASHPEKQTKLWTELEKRFAHAENVTVNGTKEIPYLDAVINEALRLCFAVPGGLPRVVPEGGDTYAGHHVPEGTSISIRPYVVFHSSTYFHKAWDYVPERWLPADQRPKEHAADRLAACQPFNVGPTNCIGKPLAWAEMRLLVAKIILTF
ncbi:cytochrome P450 [Massariosphaeria phaeospora]|uniref:Cytochrome P450 n=1 Tax=Massariosphaeria phaeospora TaxID=100035 RepID=A0A7C8M0C7_9PLEO|nr:cytochrome P450 [Massariosphaeria phaeospora]